MHIKITPRLGQQQADQEDDARKAHLEVEINGKVMPPQESVTIEGKVMPPQDTDPDPTAGGST